MKLKNIIASVLLTLGVGAGTATAIASFQNSEVKETTAATTTTYYLDKSYIVTKLGWWKTDNTYFSYKKANTNSYYKPKMNKISDTLFSYTTSDAIESFEFYVYDTSSNQNKTVWQAPESDKNYYYITTGNGSALQKYEAGMYFEDTEVTNKPSINTKRVWLINNVSWWANNSAVQGIRYWDDSGTKKFTQLTKFTDSLSGKNYFYADIDVSATGYAAVRRIPNALKPAYWNKSSDINNEDTTMVAYIPADNTVISYGNEPKVHVDFALKFLEGYDTCSTNKANGFLNIVNLDKNIFSKLTAADKNTFLTKKIDNTYTVSNKLETMQKEYDEHMSNVSPLGAFNVSKLSDNSSVNLVWITLGILASTLVIYVAIRRKKEVK